MEKMVDHSFWRNKKVFLTGHTGFKGTWLSIILDSLGANVSGYSLAPISNPSFFDAVKKNLNITSYIGDIRDYINFQEKINYVNPEVIIHLAAQPLVRLSYDDPVETYETNVLGLVNLLDISKNLKSLRVVLNVTSDKCYENNERDHGYQESDRLGGYDPYSNSKACAELVTASFRQSFFEKSNIGLASARAGNVIGGGDWSQDRLIPDFIRAQQSDKSLQIRNPKAIRPWQHVIEPLVGYLLLCEKLYTNSKKYSEAWNFGPSDLGVMNVESVIQEMQANINKSVDVNYNRDEIKHEASLLKLDVSKVRKQLQWKSLLSFKDTIKLTLDWYENYYANKNIYQYSQSQLQKYFKLIGR